MSESPIFRDNSMPTAPELPQRDAQGVVPDLRPEGCIHVAAARDLSGGWAVSVGRSLSSRDEKRSGTFG